MFLLCSFKLKITHQHTTGKHRCALLYFPSAAKGKVWHSFLKDVKTLALGTHWPVWGKMSVTPLPPCMLLRFTKIFVILFLHSCIIKVTALNLCLCKRTIISYRRSTTHTNWQIWLLHEETSGEKYISNDSLSSSHSLFPTPEPRF